jgi:hypothetical protein
MIFLIGVDIVRVPFVPLKTGNGGQRRCPPAFLATVF